MGDTLRKPGRPPKPVEESPDTFVNILKAVVSELDELKTTVTRHDQELRALAGIVSQGFETLTELMVDSCKSLDTKMDSQHQDLRNLIIGTQSDNGVEPT